MLKNRSESAASRVHGISESEPEPELSKGRDLNRYVLLLPGEGELPEKIVTNIQIEAEKLIEKGKKQQPRNLIRLLHKIGNFRVVRDIDRNAADVIWVGVELYRKWEDKDLHETSRRGENFKETLQELSSKAERTVMDFKRDLKDFTMENPLNWPVKAIAANSMYRVNLMHVIFKKCHRKAMEESIRQAALLLGEAEEILGIIQQHRAPSLDPDESEFIAKWCNLIKQKK